MTVKSTGSCFGFREPDGGFGCRFFNALAHYKKGGALQKNGHPKPPSGSRNPKQEPVLLPASLCLTASDTVYISNLNHLCDIKLTVR